LSPSWKAQAAQKAGAIENDDATRREICKTGTDQVNKMNYIDDLTSPINTEVGDFAWAN
jgi:hypothetical protein